eukprot:3318219-Amphidinium_carterae.1
MHCKDTDLVLFSYFPMWRGLGFGMFMKVLAFIHTKASQRDANERKFLRSFTTKEPGPQGQVVTATQAHACQCTCQMLPRLQRTHQTYSTVALSCTHTGQAAKAKAKSTCP